MLPSSLADRLALVGTLALLVALCAATIWIPARDVAAYRAALQDYRESGRLPAPPAADAPRIRAPPDEAP